MVTVYNDQISEHQRNLTNSCSRRHLPELLVALDSSVRRVMRVSCKLQVNKANMQKNFRLDQGRIIAEPLYILLAAKGHPDAHGYVRRKIFEFFRKNKPLSRSCSDG